MSNEDVSVEILGVEKVEKYFKELGRDFKPALRKLSKDVSLYVHSQIPSYPTARPTSTYRRTGTLGRTIYADTKETNNKRYFQSIIGSNREYAPWTISEDKNRHGNGPQAWFHKRRWYTLQEVARKSSRAVYRIYRKGIKRLLRSV